MGDERSIYYEVYGPFLILYPPLLALASPCLQTSAHCSVTKYPGTSLAQDTPYVITHCPISIDDLLYYWT